MTQTAAILIIGNEILSGRTQDTNANFIALQLEELGITLKEIRVIPDIHETIIATAQQFHKGYDYVFTTGGIGPTHDDITAECIAKAFAVKLEQNARAYEILLAHYGAENLTDARLKMAQIPVGAALIHNPVSAAPGFKIENVFVMAGVPKIMQAMWEHVKTFLAAGEPIISVTVSCGLPESAMAEQLGVIQERYPALSIGSYPYFRMGAGGVSFVIRGTDKAAIDKAAQEIVAAVQKMGSAVSLF
ncbi:MAG: competence/damage-inducible protein A [Alphaproteobacteria bacterium]|nr:competence/damage-inducible protein A [Alphaproteobacteria bacterium]